MITEFLLTYAKMLATHSDAVSVELREVDEMFDEIVVYADREDVGKLIGKEGKMINAVKTVISGCKAKGGKNYRVNVQAVN